jgi:putative tryptophan/tyrosine transport system substrate-binding protein
MVGGIRRRELITALAGTTVGWPLFARAQQPALPVIGFMSGRSKGESMSVVGAFHQGLAETGYVEGANITIEYRWADGKYERLPVLAAELVDRHVAVVAAVGGSLSGLAAKAATAAIPVVFASGGDAVKLGLVPSLNRPDGNVTGVNLIFSALGAKRLEVLRTLIPNASTVAMLVNLNYPSAPSEVQDVQDGARALGLQIAVLNAPAESDFEPAFATIAGQKLAGLLVADDPFLESRRGRLVGLAASHAVPAIYIARDFVDDGGLMSYGPSIIDAYRLVGIYVGRILKGEKPSELPVVQPTKFELVINLKTAKVLGIEIPAKLLATADDVIE